MTETTIENLTYTVVVGKKVSDGAYGSDEIGIHVQVDMPNGTDPTSDDAQKALRDAVNAAKAQVGVGLGIGTVMDSEGCLRYDTPVGASRGEASQNVAPTSGAVASGVPVMPPHTNPERGSQEEKDNQNWVAARWQVAPNEFWDNEKSNAEKGNSNWPNLKHKDLGRKAGWDNDLVGWKPRN